MKKKTIVSCCGIRPDLIRCANIFKEFDKSDKFKHILIWSGQHYDKNLSDVFFQDLDIRTPDFDLGLGLKYKDPIQLSANVGVEVISCLKENSISPDYVFYLGDSNTVLSSLTLRKEYGDKVSIIHCESGMRSGDKFRQQEEINRTVCDHCSDIRFVYHENYVNKLRQENLWSNNFVVGNTIVEVCNEIKQKHNINRKNATKDFILMDIHRPENFNYPERMKAILNYAFNMASKYGVFVRFLDFPRTRRTLEQQSIELPSNIKFRPLMGYIEFLREQNNSLFVISDSGTSQEECPLLDVPIICPREFTERPESMENSCSFLLKDPESKKQIGDSIHWLECYESDNTTKYRAYQNHRSVDWLGDGTTSKQIINILENMK